MVGRRGLEKARRLRGPRIAYGDLCARKARPGGWRGRDRRFAGPLSEHVADGSVVTASSCLSGGRGRAVKPPSRPASRRRRRDPAVLAIDEARADSSCRCSADTAAGATRLARIVAGSLGDDGGHHPLQDVDRWPQSRPLEAELDRPSFANEEEDDSSRCGTAREQDEPDRDRAGDRPARRLGSISARARQRPPIRRRPDPRRGPVVGSPTAGHDRTEESLGSEAESRRRRG